MPDKNVEANFVQFIGGFAVQTLVHLGKMSNPMTGQTSIDLVNAKYSIDILGILQEKTNGNLNEEEDEYLANLLRDLRMEYVAVSNKNDSAESAAGDAAEGESGGDNNAE